MKTETFIKNNTELIIVPYSDNKFCIVVNKNNGIKPVFPFNSKGDAKKWVENYKGD
ncbi:MAG: hypothetical protein P9M13_07860 [Candidatus Ancaeobacter aquaticus]|nr:hypothetical protein [Candidatus Ancaeobacter aquaticus]